MVNRKTQLCESVWIMLARKKGRETNGHIVWDGYITYKKSQTQVKKTLLPEEVIATTKAKVISQVISIPSHWSL